MLIILTTSKDYSLSYTMVQISGFRKNRKSCCVFEIASVFILN